MGTNMTNYSLKSPPTMPDPKDAKKSIPNPTATDVHITVEKDDTSKLKVLNVEGIPPSPTAPYNVSGNGTNDVSITNISVPPGGELHVRLEAENPKGAEAKFTYKWTYPPKVNGNESSQSIASAVIDGGSEGESAVALVELLETLLKIARERVITSDSL